MLTKNQLKKIEEIIRKRFLRLTYDALGERALTESELNTLKRAGLLKPSVRHFVGDAYTLGKIVSHMDKATASRITYDKAMAAAEKFPMTEVEKEMVNFASDHAGQYIQGIAENTVKEVRAIGARHSMDALTRVKEEVAEAIKDRKTVGELKTVLHRVIKGKERDWLRVASTEMNDAIQKGIHAEIKKNSPVGGGQLVYKRPSPNACKYCKRLYLRRDGVTPKIFTLDDLTISNIGLSSSDWTPTIGSAHPWCQCQLSPVPDGFDFVISHIATEDFGGYKRGQVVDNFSALSEDDKKKTRKDAILSFTGENSSPTIEKSFGLDDEEECTCHYGE